MLWRTTETSPAPVSDVVSTFDFEPDILGQAVAAAGEAKDGSVGSNGKPAVFIGDFESGDLSGWSTNS